MLRKYSFEKLFLYLNFFQLSSLHTNEEDAKIETDKEEEEEEYSSILDRVKANIFKPFETAATNLRDKVQNP